MNSKSIWKSRDLELKCSFGTEGALFNDVIKVRSDSSGKKLFPFDDYSTHYVLFQESTPVGTLSSTRSIDGPIDCFRIYPEELFQGDQSQLVSTCKFRVRHTGGMRTLRQIVKNVWRHRIQHGIKVDVINIRETDQRIFERIGYRKIRGCEFLHPTLRTASIGMILCADPNHRSFASEVFKSQSQPKSFAAFEHLLEVSPQPAHKSGDSASMEALDADRNSVGAP